VATRATYGSLDRLPAPCGAGRSGCRCTLFRVRYGLVLYDRNLGAGALFEITRYWLLAIGERFLAVTCAVLISWGSVRLVPSISWRSWISTPKSETQFKLICVWDERR
jgi:hypothetical protein